MPSMITTRKIARTTEPNIRSNLFMQANAMQEPMFHSIARDLTGSVL
jgi:hypothetical protein